MSRLESQLKELPTRTAHLYRSVWQRYTEWLRTAADVDGAGGYDSMLARRLVVRYVVSQAEAGRDAGATVAALTWYAGAVNADGECSAAYLARWLQPLVRLLQFDARTVQHVVDKVSINLWNPATETLQSKHFKTCQDKLKLLLDFQWKCNTNVSFESRSRVSLRDLRRVQDAQHGKCGLAHAKEPSFVLIPDFESPLTCPVFTMAVYYYLRFHGVRKHYKGDGYPILSEFSHVPIIRGKLFDQYPRELTLGNWYPTIFKYCQLPYTKKDWFQVNPEWPQFPSVSEADFSAESDAESVIGIPDVFVRKMNRAAYRSCPEPRLRLFPTDVPEDLQPIFDLLNAVLLTNLPLLYRVFPTHDIFLDPSLKTPQILAHITGPISFDIESQKPLLSLLVDRTGLASEVSLPLRMKTDSNEPSTVPLTPINLEDRSSPVSYDAVKAELQKMIQLHTTMAFSQLITVLLEIFNRLDFKRSNKQFVIDLLQSCRTDVRNQLQRPASVADEVSLGVDEEGNSFKEDSVQEPPSKRSRPDYKEDPLSDDDGNMEELAQLVNQLITRKFNENLEQQTDRILSALQPTLREMVRAEVAEVLTGPIQETSSPAVARRTAGEEEPTSSELEFQMKPDNNNIQDIILEWFTPNPECVHSMNKKYGNKWRLSEPNRSIYRTTKPIIQFYIHLINEKKMDKFEAFKSLEALLQKHGSIAAMSSYLDSNKKNGYDLVT